MADVIGKLQITYEQPDNTKLTETPFYIHGNLLYVASNASGTQDLRHQMQERVEAAVAQMTELSNNTYVSSKVIYEVPIMP